MEELRAVLFDLDGVLVDSKEAWYQLVNATARKFCKPDIQRKSFDAGWGQGIDADVRDFFPGCSHQEIESYYEQHLLDFESKIVVESDARATLVKLRDGGILRGVITNTPTFLAREILAAIGLIGFVDITVGAGGRVAPKPAPDVVTSACTSLEIDPAQAVVVGDSRFDEQAARAAKASFAGFRMDSARSVKSLSEIVRLVLP